MENLRKNGLAYAVVTLAVGVAAFGAYERTRESRQPEIKIHDAVITRIEPYSHRSELGLGSSKGNDVRVEGETRPIRFDLENWDGTVRVGDRVDLTARQKYDGGLEGLQINDNK